MALTTGTRFYAAELQQAKQHDRQHADEHCCVISLKPVVPYKYDSQGFLMTNDMKKFLVLSMVAEIV